MTKLIKSSIKQQNFPNFYQKRANFHNYQQNAWTSIISQTIFRTSKWFTAAAACKPCHLYRDSLRSLQWGSPENPPRRVRLSISSKINYKFSVFLMELLCIRQFQTLLSRTWGKGRLHIPTSLSTLRTISSTPLQWEEVWSSALYLLNILYQFSGRWNARRKGEKRVAQKSSSLYMSSQGESTSAKTADYEVTKVRMESASASHSHFMKTKSTIFRHLKVEKISKAIILLFSFSHY